jgi:hypothetical protein
MGPGFLPFGWTIGAGWAREDVDRLDQDYEARFVRGDVILPGVADLRRHCRRRLREYRIQPAGYPARFGRTPVVTPGGRLIADPSGRACSLTTRAESSGMLASSGVRSRRTELQARVGRRYGDMTYTGSFRHS